MSDQLLRAALWYARHLGWHVLPIHGVVGTSCDCGRPDCPSPGKHPLTPRGVKDASADPDQIAAWWRRWPNANVGLATGEPSGVWVLDIDGDSGRDTLAELERAHGPLPMTIESLTGGGGRHLFFRHDPRRPLPNRVRFAAGLDVRSTGGYAILPLSFHVSGHRYEWDLSSRPDQVAVAVAPDWLCRLIADASTSAAGAPTSRAYALPPTIPQGQRHNWLVSLAGTLRRRGVSERAILACLRAENAERCHPPLPDQEVESIARSVSQYPPGLARMVVRGADVALAGGGG